ncbi:hypothetical protein HDU76_004916 [Blyttiomyces sp. JEL0837]|nr:hypothetical protein HDU76_004916 [Blyttiomyces sp. JEL0837]
MAGKRSVHPTSLEQGTLQTVVVGSNYKAPSIRSSNTIRVDVHDQAITKTLIYGSEDRLNEIMERHPISKYSLRFEDGDLERLYELRMMRTTIWGNVWTIACLLSSEVGAAILLWVINTPGME